MRQKIDAILIVTKIYFNNVCHKKFNKICHKNYVILIFPPPVLPGSPQMTWHCGAAWSINIPFIPNSDKL